MTMLKRRSLRSKKKNDSAGHNSTASSAVAIALNHTVSAKFAKFQQQLSDYWQRLSLRDRLALGFLMGFLLIFIGGYGGYSLYQAADKSKADYHESVADYFWLRAQSGNINAEAHSADASGQPADMLINTLLNNSGVKNAEVIAAGASVQLSFTSDSQAIVGRALSNLQQQGWQFSRLNVQQDSTTKLLQVQATLAR